jgi:hypothetical protein
LSAGAKAVSPIEALALEALKRALAQGTVAAGEQLLEEFLTALPPDRLADVIRIATRVREARKPKYHASVKPL